MSGPNYERAAVAPTTGRPLLGQSDGAGNWNVYRPQKRVADAPSSGSHASYSPTGFDGDTVFLDIDCTAGAVTIDTLNTTNAWPGQQVFVRKSDSGASALMLGNANAKGVHPITLAGQWAGHWLVYTDATNGWAIT